MPLPNASLRLCRVCVVGLSVLLAPNVMVGPPAHAAQASGEAGGVRAAQVQPLPDPRTLLLAVEANERRMEALRREYTYHVHLEQEEIGKGGEVKKSTKTDAESLTLDGVRVDRVVQRNGKPLTPEEQAKESTRIDKEVAKAKERRAKAVARGEDTDERGDAILSVSRILELGRFSNERRATVEGRPTLVLDYTGDPTAKTRSQAEEIVRDLVGTVWIDEADHVLVRGEGHFLNDFKIGGGLIADVRKNTHFEFSSTRVDQGVWLPATINGAGSFRLLLFVGFNGRVHLQTNDYRRFRTSAIILPGQSKVDASGAPVVPGPSAPPEQPKVPSSSPQR